MSSFARRRRLPSRLVGCRRRGLLLRPAARQSGLTKATSDYLISRQRLLYMHTRILLVPCPKSKQDAVPCFTFLTAITQGPVGGFRCRFEWRRTTTDAQSVKTDLLLPKKTHVTVGLYARRPINEPALGAAVPIFPSRDARGFTKLEPTPLPMLIPPFLLPLSPHRR